MNSSLLKQCAGWTNNCCC